eukprot:352044-Chlamydomonas_euryale.AAC.3
MLWTATGDDISYACDAYSDAMDLARRAWVAENGPEYPPGESMSPSCKPLPIPEATPPPPSRRMRRRFNHTRSVDKARDVITLSSVAWQQDDLIEAVLPVGP